MFVSEVDAGPPSSLQRLGRLDFDNFKFSFEVLMPDVDWLVADVRHLRGALQRVVDHALVQVGDWILVKCHKPEPRMWIRFPVLKYASLSELDGQPIDSFNVY